ncbi:MAG: ribonuclease HII [Defluviitaleaceae bacterium]|nr:ribonuclease HII [Defluviitaleaceae bacterium]
MNKNIAGVDEVGRGCLAGPVVSAAVILPSDFLKDDTIELKDSKKLSEKKRDEFYELIMRKALAIGIGVVHHDIIDEINILEATKLSMIKAVNALSIKPDFLLIDALNIKLDISQEAVIKGDEKHKEIAAASIIAKVTRDRMMKEYDLQYDVYNFKRNKGYGTKEHKEAIKKHGFCNIHRRSFKPKDLFDF